jgi:hypothetical protein
VAENQESFGNLKHYRPFRYIDQSSLHRSNEKTHACCSRKRTLGCFVGFSVVAGAIVSPAQAEKSRQTLAWQGHDNKDPLTDKVTPQAFGFATFPDGTMAQAFTKCADDGTGRKFPGLTIAVGAFQTNGSAPKAFAWEKQAIRVPLTVNDERRHDIHLAASNPQANQIAVRFYDPAGAKRFTHIEVPPLMKLEQFAALASAKQSIAWDNFVAQTAGTLSELLHATSVRVQLTLADGSANVVDINPQDSILRAYAQQCNSAVQPKSQ